MTLPVWPVLTAEEWRAEARKLRQQVAKFNPYHEPAGSPIGGQFASSPEGSAEFGRWTDATPAGWAGHTVYHGGTLGSVEDIAKPTYFTPGKALADLSAASSPKELRRVVAGQLNPKARWALIGALGPAATLDSAVHVPERLATLERLRAAGVDVVWDPEDPSGGSQIIVLSPRAFVRKYDPDQPRDERGRWTEVNLRAALMALAKEGRPTPKRHKAPFAKLLERTRKDGDFDPAEHPRGKTTPESNEGSFAPKGGGMTDAEREAEARRQAFLAKHYPPNMRDTDRARALRLHAEAQQAVADLTKLEGQLTEAVLNPPRILPEPKADGGGDTADEWTWENDDVENYWGSWDNLPDKFKSEVEEAWKEDTKSDFYNSEVESWQENSAQADAYQQIIHDEATWRDLAEEALVQLGVTPASAKTAAGILEATFNEDISDNYKLEDNIFKGLAVDNPEAFYGALKFNETEPEDGGTWYEEGPPFTMNDPNQETLPGTEKFVNEEPWSDFNTDFEKEFASRLTNKAENMDVEPPDYLEESAQESQESYFEEGMAWQWVKDNVDAAWLQDHLGDKSDWIDPPEKEEEDAPEPPEDTATAALPPEAEFVGPPAPPIHMPKEYAYFSEPGGGGVPVNVPESEYESIYRRTKGIAQAMQRLRTEELMKEPAYATDYHISEEVIAQAVWQSWKGSSGNTRSMAVRDAFTQEFALPELKHERARDIAEGYREMAGLFGIASGRKDGAAAAEKMIRAHLRATWETTQWLASKSGLEHFDVYRAIYLPEHKTGDIPGWADADGQRVMIEDKHGGGMEYMALTNLPLLKQALQSTAGKRNLVNSWGGVNVSHKLENTKRVVLRARIPIEAALSLPVFGQNHHNEDEAVVTSAPWKHWDAWLDQAPSFSDWDPAKHPRDPKTGRFIDVPDVPPAPAKAA